uniref:DNA lyase n=1 Tax=candidate division WOR-3 bacterium TaxID=2052148 RepID=A0A7C4TD31_UNCW3
MRLWTIHPEYLDTRGLVALWREGLLAKKVLEGKTRGYKNHPQIYRFKNFVEPLKAINSYLYYVYLEGQRRNYNFDINKISLPEKMLTCAIPVKSEDVDFEFLHLCKKLKVRDKKRYRSICNKKMGYQVIKLNPLFYSIP